MPKKNRAKSKDLDLVDLLEEATIPTSTMMSLLVQYSTHKQRLREDQEQSLQTLRHITTEMCRCNLGQLGVQGVNVDSNGFLRCPPWPTGVQDQVRRLWDMDLVCKDNFWVQSNFDTPHVVDCVAFIDRPVLQKERRRDLKGWKGLRENLKGLLSPLVNFLTECLHQNILQLSMSDSLKRKADAEEGTQRGAKRKRRHQNTHSMLIETSNIIQKLYSGEDTWISLQHKLY